MPNPRLHPHRSIGDKDALSRPQYPLVPNATSALSPPGVKCHISSGQISEEGRRLGLFVYCLYWFIFSKRYRSLPASVHWVKNMSPKHDQKIVVCVFIERSHTE